MSDKKTESHNTALTIAKKRRDLAYERLIQTILAWEAAHTHQGVRGGVDIANTDIERARIDYTLTLTLVELLEKNAQ